MSNFFKFLSVMFFILTCTLFAEDHNLEQLTRLEAHLAKIQNDAKFQRIVGGSVMIGSGCLIGIGGTIVSELSITETDYSTYMKNMITGVSIGAGVTCISTGLIILLIRNEYETVPEKFNNLLANNEDDIAKKIIVGESNLESLSNKAQYQRFLNAGILAVTGIAQLVYYSTFPSSSDSVIDYYSSVKQTLLYDGILFCGSSIVYFLIKTPAEMEYKSYKEWKAGKTNSKITDNNAIKLSINPFNKTIALSFTL